MNDIRDHNPRDLQVVHKLIESELRPLITGMVKFLRAGINPGPDAPFVEEWMTTNPTAAARALGLFAYSAAQREMASSSWTG